MKINIFTTSNARLFSKIRWTIFMSLLMIIQLCNAQIPSLGDVENFTLFTNTGALNNTGTSKIVGDIGTQAGAYTGFPPGVLSGQSHIADSTSVRIATMVTSLYAYFVGLTGDSVLG